MSSCQLCQFWCADDRQFQREAPCPLIKDFGVVRVLEHRGQDIITARDFSCSFFQALDDYMPWDDFPERTLQ